MVQTTIMVKLEKDIMFCIDSDDKEILTWASDTFSTCVEVVNLRYLKICKLRGSSIMVFSCDYKCKLDKCLNKIRIAGSLQGRPIIIARQLIARASERMYPRYLMCHINYGKQPNSSPAAPNELAINPSRQWISAPLDKSAHEYPVLLAQKLIVGKAGEIKRVTELKGMCGLRIAGLARLFKEIVGEPPKRLIDRIRICHSLWRLGLSTDSVKCIAYEFGYHPESFSLKFFKSFGVWPSEVSGQGLTAMSPKRSSGPPLNCKK